MTHGLVVDFPGPIEFYDALHAEVKRRSAGTADGLLLHVGRATTGGFQMLEIWESKEKFERFFGEVVLPAMEAVSPERSPSSQPVMEEFEPRGLVVPSAVIAV